MRWMLSLLVVVPFGCSRNHSGTSRRSMSCAGVGVVSDTSDAGSGDAGALA